MFRSPFVSRRSLLASTAAALLAMVGPAVADSAAPEAAPVLCVDISGCWDCGYWKSFCNSHHGTLRATISRCGANYSVTFSGTFLKVVPFRYTQVLTVTGYGDGVVYFRASRNIPMFGGQFCMTGSATACKFTAHYTSKKDRGVFVLSR